ncbi:MFS transporter [Mesorhizobium sp. NBSH29]|uniref:MFS transporter n=1 Tax=Mesorhizobium sp. NBSH29 TaxID=2654249 RepID=UPI00189656F8|nr:MFS transporter [Mesorhizobium sp. NBSH29]QPC86590.1 MFS transporter [Mesorhizobium sp. NBSH29]
MSKLNQSAPVPAVPGIPAAAYVLTGCIGVIGSNSLALGPIAPEVARSLGASVAMVMLASGAFGLGTAASALFLARHIDRLGAGRMLRLSMVVLSATMLACAVAPTLMVLVAAQCAAGIASGVALPAIYSSAAAIAPPGRESRTIGLVLTGWTLSMVAGVSLAAVVADFIHWRAVYSVVALLALVASAGMALLPAHQAAATGPASSPLATANIEGVKPLLLACGAFMTAFYGVYGYLGAHLHDGLGQSVSANGLAALIYGIGFGSATALDGVADRVGARRMMPIVFVIVAVVYLLLGLAASSFVAVLAVVFLWGLSNHLGLNLLIMRLTSIDPSQRGTVMGLNSAVTYLAVFAGTGGFGPIYARFGFSAAAYCAMALTLVAAVAGSYGGARRQIKTDYPA